MGNAIKALAHQQEEKKQRGLLSGEEASKKCRGNTTNERERKRGVPVDENARSKRQRLMRDSSNTEMRQRFVMGVSKWLRNLDANRPSPLRYSLCSKTIQDTLHISANYLYRKNKEGIARIEVLDPSGRNRKKTSRSGLPPVDDLAQVCTYSIHTGGGEMNNNLSKGM